MENVLFKLLFISLCFVCVYLYLFYKPKNRITKNVPYFREIPCNKDIFYAYWVAVNYKLMEKREDFLGAILLRWINNGNIKTEKVTKNNEEFINIIFCKRPPDTFELEDKLYDFMYESSIDGKLEFNEFILWCNRNSSKILSWFDDVLYFQTIKLLKKGKVSYPKNKKLKGFSYSYFKIDNSMIEEAEKLAGLKKYLAEFTLIDEKEFIEIGLWKEYLVYAQMFGLADKVSYQFENLYPDTIVEMSGIGYHNDVDLFSLVIDSIIDTSK